MLCFSLVVAGGTALAYLLDTHGANALHILAVTGFAQNMVRYSTTFFADSLVRTTGVERSLLVLGACQAGCWLASILMYVYGKRVRSFVSTSARRSLRDFSLSALLNGRCTLHRSRAIPDFSAETSPHPTLPNLRPRPPTGTVRVEVSIESPRSPSLRDES